MLDLKAGVHLEEEKLAVLKEELNGSSVDVAAGLGDLDGRFAHGATDFVGEVGGRRLFDQLLVATLGRAVTLAEPQHVAMGVGQNLHFDVAGPGQVALDVALRATEVAQGFALGALEEFGGFLGRVDDLHTATTTAVGGLDCDGPAVLITKGHNFVTTGERVVTTRDTRDAGGLGRNTR